MMKTVKILTFCLLLVACTKGVVLYSNPNTQPSFDDCVSNCKKKYAANTDNSNFNLCTSSCWENINTTF